MEAIEERPAQKKASFGRVAKPLQACFKSEFEARQEWQEHDAEIMPGFLHVDAQRVSSGRDASAEQVPTLDAVTVPYRLSRKVMEEYHLHVQRVRTAQQKGKHRFAIKLTTRALRLIRQQPKFQRSALSRQTQELLNLRSLSLIAIGECGEAWRCIALMAKLWDKQSGHLA